MTNSTGPTDGATWYNLLTGDVWVPNLPTTRYDVDHQVIYLWMGLQATGGGQLLQPVLSYGYNEMYGGDYWSIASWFYDCDNCFDNYPGINNHMVNPGDHIHWYVSMALEGTYCSNSGLNCDWYVGFTVNGQWGDSVYLPALPYKFDGTLYAVLETPNNGFTTFGVSQCSDFPQQGYAAFAASGVYEAFPNWYQFTQRSYNPAIQYDANESPQCGYGWLPQQPPFIPYTYLFF